ncbi:MAG: hypothetical protein FJX76_11475 [Armatimonadetes bacterium]|nr:hypothetical protein [Armatimonadota bacterium]
MDAVNLQAVPEQVPQELGTQFDTAINKIKSAPKKARKKIPPDTIPKLETNKANSVGATTNARQTSVAAVNAFNSNPLCQQAVSGGLENLDFKDPGLQGAAEVNYTLGASYTAPAFSSTPGGGYMGVMDVDVLAGALRTTRTDGSQMMQALGQVGNDQMIQSQANAGLAQHVQSLGQLGQKFAMQENMFGMKEMMFKGIAKTLEVVGKTLGMAARGLQMAAQGVEAAAAAVAGIPFVGAALAAALRAVAAMLKAIAKGLEMMAKKLESVGKTMLQKAEAMCQMKEKMKLQKLETLARQQLAENHLNQGMQRLAQISGEKDRISGLLGQNMMQQNDILTRLAELGVGAGGGMAALMGAVGGMQMGMMAGQMMNNMAAMSQMSQMGGPQGMPNMPNMGMPNMPNMGMGGMPTMGMGGMPTMGMGGMPTMGAGPAAPVVNVINVNFTPLAAAQPSIPQTTGQAQQPQVQAAAAPSKVAGIQQENATKPEDPKTDQKNPGDQKNQQGDQKNQDQQNKQDDPRQQADRRLASAQQARRDAASGQGAAAAPGTSNGGGSKREQYEAEIRRLAASILGGGQKENADQQAQMSRRADQRTLALLYTQVASEKIPIDAQVDDLARQALEDSPEKPSVQARTELPDIGDDGAGATAMGGETVARAPQQDPVEAGPGGAVPQTREA